MSGSIKTSRATRSARRPLAHSLAGRRPRLRVVKPHRCIATTRAGKPCTANPMRGKDRCVMHFGDNAVRFGSKGGHRRAIFNPDELVEFAPPKTARDMLLLLAQTIIEVRNARLDSRTANSIAYLSTSFLSAVESTDTDERLKKLEARFERKK